VYLLRKGRDCEVQVDSLTIAAPPLGSRTQLQAHNPQRLRRPAIAIALTVGSVSILADGLRRRAQEGD
jgi:hypothetical protein